jgi:5'-phosphate synthase pdxT subunit
LSERDRIGVLAIQGDIEAHVTALERVGGRAVRVLQERDLDGLDGLILPGGESTTISKGLTRLGLWEPLRSFAASGRPVLGTCAGAILLAREVVNHPVPTLGLLDARVTRNAYGTQVDSFSALTAPDSKPEFTDLSCVFIRAPRLCDLGPGVEVLARVDGEPVLVREGEVLASTFHPELTGDPRVHELLLRRELPVSADLQALGSAP